MQRGKSEEIPGASKETNGRVSDQVVQISREEQVDRLAKATSVEYMIIPSKVLSFVQLLPLIDGVRV